MWQIDRIEIRRRQLDFTSSTGGRPHTKALFSDGTCLVNAVSFADLGDDPTQMIVCEACGTVQCQPGGWVGIRRIGNAVAFVPAFAKMLEGESASTEFSPPDYVQSRGVPILSVDVYESLRLGVAELPPLSKLGSLTAAEAVHLLQWDAPLSVLGRFPHPPKLIRNVLLAVSDGELDHECDRLQNFLEKNIGSPSTLSAIGDASYVPIEFQLDGPGFPTWRPTVRVDDRSAFLFEPAVPVVADRETS